MNLPLFKSVLRPITRVLVGLIAIPIFRFFMRKIFRLQDLDDELEKDLEQWFRGALLLLAATANMEHLLFGWMDELDWMERMDWLTVGLRLMLAISVFESMPDQEWFAVIHPGPPKVKPGKSVLKEIWTQKWAFVKGFICQHLNRSSPVLAMMAAIVGAELMVLTPAQEAEVDQALIVYEENGGDVSAEVTEAIRLRNEARRTQERWMVGWVCYLLAITQYLIIGLVTSRDRAMDVLSEFDRAVAERRRELIDEFEIKEGTAEPDSNAKPVEPNSTEADNSVTNAAADADLPSDARLSDSPGAADSDS